MSDHLDVDPELVAGYARTLNSGGDALNDVGANLPDSPDAGEMTADLTGLLSIFADNTGQLVKGVLGAGQAVSEAAGDYQNGENTNADTFNAS
ncbi:MAG: hypothetical protein GEU98_21505 [Pseudonocardiaceae bacterium]|nr:hypothetical protein [Pseudonocardiaceae bacterium]